MTEGCSDLTISPFYRPVSLCFDMLTGDDQWMQLWQVDSPAQPPLQQLSANLSDLSSAHFPVPYMESQLSSYPPPHLQYEPSTFTQQGSMMQQGAMQHTSPQQLAMQQASPSPQLGPTHAASTPPQHSPQKPYFLQPTHHHQQQQLRPAFSGHEQQPQQQSPLQSHYGGHEQHLQSQFSGREQQQQHQQQQHQGSMPQFQNPFQVHGEAQQMCQPGGGALPRSASVSALNMGMPWQGGATPTSVSRCASTSNLMLPGTLCLSKSL